MPSFAKMVTPIVLIGSTVGFAVNPVQALTLFADYYAPANWNKSIGNGTINTSSAPNTVSLQSSNIGSGLPGNTDFTITAPSAGTVSFDWNFTTVDPPASYDPFGYLKNGVFTFIVNPDAGNQAGSASFSVLAGDVFGFRQRTTDDCCGSATTFITNFDGPVPVPAPLPLLSAYLPLGFCRRLRSRSKRLRHGASRLA